MKRNPAYTYSGSIEIVPPILSEASTVSLEMNQKHYVQ